MQLICAFVFTYVYAKNMVGLCANIGKSKASRLTLRFRVYPTEKFAPKYRYVSVMSPCLSFKVITAKFSVSENFGFLRYKRCFE